LICPTLWKSTIFEEGELQDNLGHKVSFRNSVLIMTSNAGAREISRDSALGFRSNDGLWDYQEIKSSAMNELRKKFRPEFINRVDEIVVFHSLTKDQLGKIFDIMISEVTLRLLEMNIYLSLSKSARDLLIDKGYDTKYGARPLRRVIQKELEDPLSMEVLKGNLAGGCQLAVEVRNGKINFRIKKEKPVPAKVTG